MNNIPDQKSYFILFCKILGLVLFFYGVLTTLSTLPMLFSRPSFMGADSFSTMFGNSSEMREISRYMNQAEKKMWWDIIILISLSGICPAVLGFYLMKSGTFFINLCYPDESYMHPEISKTEEDQAPSSEEESDDDRKYMHPSMK